MRISHRFRLVYFSIPKTGSESVRALLDPVSDEKIVTFPDVDERTPFHSHMRPYDVRTVFCKKGWEFDAYLKIATVRNPWARLASLYRMMCRNRGDQWKGTFSDWIQTLDPTGRSTSHMPEKWYAHGTMSMTNFLSDPEGQLLVDQVFRVEDQSAALSEMIATRVGEDLVEQGLAHRNKAEHPYNWQTMYSVQDQNRVADLYSDDVERFGYAFENQV